MADDRLKTWETLFQRALALIDSVAKSGTKFEPWSFGGGTVLMRRQRQGLHGKGHLRFRPCRGKGARRAA
jgi:hypothetical protein